MGKWFSKGWNWFSGKKSVIGTVVWLGAKGVGAFAPQLLDPAQVDFIENLGLGIMSLGGVHKITKIKSVTDAINRGTKMYKRK